VSEALDVRNGRGGEQRCQRWRNHVGQQQNQIARPKGRAQEEERLRGQGPQVHPQVLQAAHLLQPLQGLHLVSGGGVGGGAAPL